MTGRVTWQGLERNGQCRTQTPSWTNRHGDHSVTGGPPEHRPRHIPTTPSSTPLGHNAPHLRWRYQDDESPTAPQGGGAVRSQPPRLQKQVSHEVGSPKTRFCPQVPRINHFSSDWTCQPLPLVFGLPGLLEAVLHGPRFHGTGRDCSCPESSLQADGNSRSRGPLSTYRDYPRILA